LRSARRLPIQEEMAPLKQTETIDVRAPAQVAYDVVAGDLLKVVDGPDAMVSRRPLDEGPLRVGFRFGTTVVHNRKLCVSKLEISELDAGRLLEQSFSHYCADSERETRGGDRWEFAARADGSAVVTLSSWRQRHGLGGWLLKLLGSGEAARLELRKRLAYVQFEAERRARQDSR
jgi:hypothetical protein